MKSHRRPRGMNQRCLIAAAFFVVAFILFSPSFVARQGRPETPMERMRRERAAQQMREMELRNAATLGRNRPTTEDPAARARYNQISEDYVQMQTVNLEMLRATFPVNAPAPIYDYERIARTMQDINRRAARLRGNLNLPEARNTDSSSLPREITNNNQLRASLLMLNDAISSFVANPMFHNAVSADTTDSVKARTDLDKIVELSRRIRQSAQRMRN